MMAELLRLEIASLRQEIDTLKQDKRILTEKLRKTSNGVEYLSFDPEFIRFAKLPAEIRISIWKIACFNQPRVIRLHHNRLRFYCRGNHPPSILHTTSESRCEALKYYKRKAVDFGRYTDQAYQHRQKHGEFPCIPGSQTYFNFDIDILFPVIDESWIVAFNDQFRTNWSEIITKHKTLRRFRHIAVPINSRLRVYECYNSWCQAVYFLTRPRSKIQEISLVVGLRLSLVSEPKLLPILDEDWVTSTFSTHAGICYARPMRYELKWIRDQSERADSFRGPEYLEEDAPSGDEDEGNYSNQKSPITAEKDAQDARPKKPLPTIKYAYIDGSFPSRAQ